jgi:hypothetical protein
MNLPPTEMEIFQGMPVQNTWFVFIIGIPLLITLGVIIFSRKYIVNGKMAAMQVKEVQDAFEEK